MKSGESQFQKNNMKKKAQEDIAGFVIILVVVMVVLLIVIAIFVGLSRKPSEENSIESEQFLQALLQYTTECATSYEPAYASVQELAVKCAEGARCTSARMACEVLNTTLKGAINATFKVNATAQIKGYQVTITKKGATRTAPPVTILTLKEGSQDPNSPLRGASQPFTSLTGETFQIALQIRY